MHSPPVQPSSASTSGTGSVITRWLEVTVSRRRSGRWPTRAGPVARAARGARTQPRSVCASTPWPVVREPPDRRALEDGHPALLEASAKPERQPRRLNGGGHRVEDPGPEDRGIAASPHLGLRQGPADAGNAQLGTGVGDRPPGVVVRRSRRDLKVAAGAVPGVHPLLLAPAPDLPNRVLRRSRQPQRGGVAEALSKRWEAEPHRVHEAAVAPARPRRRSARPPAGPRGPRGSSSLSEPRRPHSRVSAAHHDHVRGELALQRRQLRDRARPPRATSRAPCAEGPSARATRRRASRGARSTPAARSEARRPGAAASSSRRGRGPRHSCCRPGSDPARRAARRGSLESSTGATSSTRL